MKKNLLIICSLLLLITSCKKPQDGATGPAGPAGNANVSVFYVSCNSGNWSYDATNKVYFNDFLLSQISSAVLQNGTVNVFLTDSGHSFNSALPMSYQNIEFNYVVQLNTLEIQVSNGAGTTPANPGTQYFKIVVIPQ